MDQFDPCQAVDHKKKTVLDPHLVWTKNTGMKKKLAWFLYVICQVTNPSTMRPNQEFLRIPVLSIEDWTWCNKNFLEANKSGRVSKILVVLKQRVIYLISVYMLSKMKEKMLSFKKKFG